MTQDLISNDVLESIKEIRQIDNNTVQVILDNDNSLIIDAQILTEGIISGIGKAIIGLVKALAHIYTRPPDIKRGESDKVFFKKKGYYVASPDLQQIGALGRTRNVKKFVTKKIKPDIVATTGAKALTLLKFLKLLRKYRRAVDVKLLSKTSKDWFSIIDTAAQKDKKISKSLFGIWIASKADKYAVMLYRNDWKLTVRFYQLFTDEKWHLVKVYNIGVTPKIGRKIMQYMWKLIDKYVRVPDVTATELPSDIQLADEKEGLEYIVTGMLDELLSEVVQ